MEPSAPKIHKGQGDGSTIVRPLADTRQRPASGIPTLTTKIKHTLWQQMYRYGRSDKESGDTEIVRVVNPDTTNLP